MEKKVLEVPGSHLGAAVGELQVCSRNLQQPVQETSHLLQLHENCKVEKHTSDTQAQRHEGFNGSSGFYLRASSGWAGALGGRGTQR